MSSKDKRVSVDLEGASLEINDELHTVTDGQFTATVDYLYSAGDDPENPTEKIVSKEIKIETEQIAQK